MVQHGVTNDRSLTSISPLSVGFPHHFDAAGTDNPKMKSRLEAG